MNSSDTPAVSPAEAILWAANWPEPGADLGRADFLLLHRAAESGVLIPDAFAALVRNVCRGRPLVQASRARFDLAMDYLFGHGFRDPALPELSPDYRDFLDAAKRVLEIPDEEFAAMLGRAPGGATPEHVTGEAFGYCLYEMFLARRMAIPNLPERSYMDRAAIGQIHAAVTGLGLSYEEHLNVLVMYGGGCLRTKDLDAHGAQRVLARYFGAGWVEPEPAPRVEVRPGYVSQAQVNLIWHLARQLGIADADTMGEWLQTVAEIKGGLLALTAAGARYVIDRMLPPAIAMREGVNRERTEAGDRAARHADGP